MKREITKNVAIFLKCQPIRIEHNRPEGKMQPLPIPEWKWEYITIDFMMALPKTLVGSELV